MELQRERSTVHGSFSGTLQAFQQSLGNELYIPSLELSPDLYSRYASRSSRSSELYIGDDQVVESEIVVSFPQDCKIVKLLKNINVTNNNINYKREFQNITPSMIKIKTSLSVYKGVVKYNKYSEFKEYLRELKRYEKEYVIVTKN